MLWHNTGVEKMEQLGVEALEGSGAPAADVEAIVIAGDNDKYVRQMLIVSSSNSSRWHS